MLKIPVSPETIAHFVAYLEVDGVAPSTIQSIVSGIGFFHRIKELPNPSTSYLVKRVILGAKAKAAPPVQAYPIQKDMLHKMCNLAMDLLVPSYDAMLVTAMLLFGYHGCLRFGEMGNSGGLKHTITLEKVKMRKEKGERWVEFVMESYKNSKGPVVFRIREGDDERCCPVKALERFLFQRGNDPGPLFTRKNGNAVTRDFFAKQIKFLVTKAGHDASKYNTHSLRAGRATDLAMAGTPDAIIKECGRWNSNAYLKYVRFNSLVLPKC